MFHYLMVLNLRIRIRFFLVSSKRKQRPSRLRSFAWRARYKWLHLLSHSPRTHSTLLLSLRRQDRTSAWLLNVSPILWSLAWLLIKFVDWLWRDWPKLLIKKNKPSKLRSELRSKLVLSEKCLEIDLSCLKH